MFHDATPNHKEKIQMRGFFSFFGFKGDLHTTNINKSWEEMLNNERKKKAYFV